MKKTKIIAALMLFILSLGLTGCASVQADDLTEGISRGQVDGKAADSDFIGANMSFSLKLFKNVQKEKPQDNVLVSPLSVTAALAMTANGADGETLSQTEELLGGNISLEQLNGYLYGCLDSFKSGEGFKLNIANSVWIKNDPNLTVEKEFLQKTVDYYDAQVYSEDFDSKTLNAVNNWVKANTGGMIPKIIDKIDQDTVMYLINALAFDTEWEKIYKDYQVKNGTFTDINGKEQGVKMMGSDEYGYLEDENAVGFLKNYKGGKYSFAALLPNENITVNEYIQGLTAEGLLKTLSKPQSCTVNTKMPKFSYDFGLSLKDTLISMGMTSAFDGTADFSKMAHYAGENIYVNDVIHKTFISVDEKGTKAGAATAVEINTESAAPADEQKTVILDRPFVYMIINNETNLPIFMGTVKSV